MAESRIEVLLKISQVNLARAEKRFNDGECDSAAFHASVAMESVASALILKLGGDEAKNQRAVSGFVAVIRRIRPDWLRGEGCEQLIDRGRKIERDCLRSISSQGCWQVGDTDGILCPGQS